MATKVTEDAVEDAKERMQRGRNLFSLPAVSISVKDDGQEESIDGVRTKEKKYADIVYVYGLCDGSSLRAVVEYERRFPNRRVPYRKVFTVYGVG
ncbi:hypothetical protein ANN_16974 [Periplaneta americana]|uniref:DUF4817 domain-containing protein n=1 Tax=Periplaneta americana TaxID=6978 RepID=A0ABQ8SRL4_PERAM|nr:hypothetical protein ANN_16974 [Periplaneta americana]